MLVQIEVKLLPLHPIQKGVGVSFEDLVDMILGIGFGSQGEFKKFKFFLLRVEILSLPLHPL
jgi:hypothetical protein